MKSMAGFAVIFLGLILVVVGIFILVNKGKQQPENQVNLFAANGKSEISETKNVDAGHKITGRKAVNPNHVKIQEVQNHNKVTKHDSLPNKEVVGNEEEAKRKGDEFEKFVVKKFNQQYFTLKEWTSDKFIDGIYAENTLGPDLVFQFSHRDISEGLAIECKWRSKLSDKFSFVTAQQIKNYTKFGQEKNIPVFVVLGIGGKPSSPEQLYIIPLDKITSAELNKDFLKEFQQETDRNVFYDPKVKSLTFNNQFKAKQPA
jgi:hypothetical protein